MKIHYILLMCSLCSSIISAQIVGTLLEEVQLSSNFTEFNPISYVLDSQDYAVGGITFVYDSGTFSQAPCITITVELLDAVETLTDAYVATVTYNDAYSTGVVAKHINSFIEEATTNSVKIHIAATGP